VAEIFLKVVYFNFHRDK